MNWHQQNAARRAFRLRNQPAHILSDSFISTGRTLCGVTDPAVWIDADRRDNPDNKCCKRCAAIADRRALV
jgi:hypothetical protein